MDARTIATVNTLPATLAILKTDTVRREIVEGTIGIMCIGVLTHLFVSPASIAKMVLREGNTRARHVLLEHFRQLAP